MTPLTQRPASRRADLVVLLQFYGGVSVNSGGGASYSKTRRLRFFRANDATHRLQTQVNKQLLRAKVSFKVSAHTP